MFTHKNFARWTLGAVCGLALQEASVHAQTQIYPPPPAPGGNYVIAVVSDGYAADEEWKFDRAINGLILNGLMTDPFYQANGQVFTIKKLFKAVAQSGQSSFKVTPNYDIHNCYITYDDVSTPDNTTHLIDTDVTALSPERTVVIANYEGVSFGCTHDTWTY